MTRKTVSLIADILLWCALCGLLIAGFSNADAVRRSPPISLRYDTPVSGKAAYNARLYSIENSAEDVFWPTFWREDTAELTSEFVTASVDCIVYSGDAALVWPAEYLTGTAPGVTDGIGCAVSSALAWTLWGSADVIGMTVEVDGTERVVRGVFRDERELALLAASDEDKVESFTAVELSGGPRGAVRDDARSYASASGLGRPDAVLMGSGTSFLADLLAALPLILPGVYGLALIIGQLRRRYAVMRHITPYVILACIALGLPALLGVLPEWMIPSRWSDFAFWSSLADDIMDGVREFLSAAPSMRDVDLRLLLLNQAGIALLSVCCALSACFRWHMRQKSNTNGRQNG